MLIYTIIFYYGDNGGILPRSKGYAYNSGLQIPLVVQVPAKWRHLVRQAPGSREAAFVNFYDLGHSAQSRRHSDAQRHGRKAFPWTRRRHRHS